MADDPNATTPPGEDADQTSSLSGPDAVGRVVAGRYKLAEKLGEGGMGTVYLARQSDPVKRLVAVKLIRAGQDSKAVLARFEAERQALALMDHPNIARVLDAGAADDGRPFFVMELVAGVPITAFCDTRRLPPKARLELFVPVCRAIQHAHQKGVIHRDIKPSNVLVTVIDDVPVPKVIDFGVAKATGQALTDSTLETGVGGLVGTPEYMSPEQASLDRVDIDTRSDVYALGVLLYELLTGSTPVDKKSLGKAALLEILRVVREVEAPRPSAKLSAAPGLPSIAANRATDPRALCRLMQGELDWVALKALDKDRARRYDTPTALARDIERYLADEVVEARPPSAAYRLRKFARRNKGRVAAAGLVLLTLVAGLTGTTWGLLRAAAAEAAAVVDRDRAEASEGRAVADRDKALAAADAERAAKDAEAVQRREAEEANRRARKALGSFTDDLMTKLLGSRPVLTQVEKDVLRNAVRQWQVFAQAQGETPAARATRSEGLFRVAGLQSSLGQRKDAESNYRAALTLQESLAAESPGVPDYRVKMANTHGNLGVLLSGGGDRAGAEAAYRAALAIQEKLAADNPRVPDYRYSLAKTHNNLSFLLSRGKDRAGAEAAYRAALAIQEKLAADSPGVPEYRSGLAATHNNIGMLLIGGGDLAGAEAAYRAALAIQEKLAADSPGVPEYRSGLAATHNNIGMLLIGGGDLAGAEAAYRAALILHEKLGADSPNMPAYRAALAATYNNLAVLFYDKGDRAAAEKAHRAALAIRQKLAADSPGVPDYRAGLATTHMNLGNMLADGGDRAGAEKAYRAALALKEGLANDSPGTLEYRAGLASVHTNLGALLSYGGDRAGAEAAYRAALAIQEKLAADSPGVPEYRSDLAATHNNLGLLLSRGKDRAGAEAAYRAALAIEQKLAADAPSVPKYRVDLGESYCNFGHLVRGGEKPADSLPWYDKAVHTLTGVVTQNPANVTARLSLRDSHLGRAKAFDVLDRRADADRDWDKAIELVDDKARPAVRAERANSRLRAGRAADAVVAELATSDAWDAGQWYDFACVTAVASRKLPAHRDEYAARAVELLRQAVAKGWDDRIHMAFDTDLDPVRHRPDYQALLAEMRAKPAAGPEAAPPPRAVVK